MKGQDQIINLELEKIKLQIQRVSKKEYIIIGFFFSFNVGLILSLIKGLEGMITKPYSNNITFFLVITVVLFLTITLFIYFYSAGEDQIFDDIENDINGLIKKVKSNRG